MNRNEVCVYTEAQTLLFRIQLEEMLAANEERRRNNLSDAYGPDSFAKLEKEANGVIGHNAFLSNLQNTLE